MKKEEKGKFSKLQSIIKGFSLVELSIVLIVFSVFIIIILRGAAIITSARVTIFSHEIKKYTNAAAEFKDIYNVDAGLMKNASDVIMGALDSTSDEAEYINPNNNVLNKDSFLFFNQLSYAKLLGKARYDGGVNVNSVDDITSSSYPFSRAFKEKFFYVRGDTVSGTYNKMNRIAVYDKTGKGFDADVLFVLDKKLDDGLPLTGTIAIEATAVNMEDDIILDNVAASANSPCLNFNKYSDADDWRYSVTYSTNGKNCKLLSIIEKQKENIIDDDVAKKINYATCSLNTNNLGSLSTGVNEKIKSGLPHNAKVILTCKTKYKINNSSQNYVICDNGVIKTSTFSGCKLYYSDGLDLKQFISSNNLNLNVSSIDNNHLYSDGSTVKLDCNNKSGYELDSTKKSITLKFLVSQGGWAISSGECAWIKICSGMPSYTSVTNADMVWKVTSTGAVYNSTSVREGESIYSSTTCKTGYEAGTGTAEYKFTCSNSGWSRTASNNKTCTLKRCYTAPSPSTIANATIKWVHAGTTTEYSTTSGIDYNKSISSVITCNSGYEKVNSTEYKLKCNENKTFTTETTGNIQCQPVKCYIKDIAKLSLTSEQINNAIYKYKGMSYTLSGTVSSSVSAGSLSYITYGETLNFYSCASGYSNYYNGKNVFTCGADGTWTASDVTRCFKNCSGLPSGITTPSNTSTIWKVGSSSGSTYTSSSTATMGQYIVSVTSCNTGYKLDPSYTTEYKYTCNNGSWVLNTTRNKQCKPVECNITDISKIAGLTSEEINNVQYSYSANNTVIGTMTGSVSYSVSLKTTTYSITTGEYNNPITFYGCNSGYTKVGDDTNSFVCNADRTWRKTGTVKCFKQCTGMPTPTLNAATIAWKKEGTNTAFSTTGKVDHGTTLVSTTACNSGYVVNSSQTTEYKYTCENGTWVQKSGNKKCGTTVMYYSPYLTNIDATTLSGNYKTKFYNAGESFNCSKTNFNNSNSIDGNVVALCAIKDNATGKYYINSYEGQTSTIPNEMQVRDAVTFCHMGNLGRDITTDNFNTNFTANAVNKANYYTVRSTTNGIFSLDVINSAPCASGYVGIPQVACSSGKWYWYSYGAKTGDNRCIKDGYDLRKLSNAENASDWKITHESTWGTRNETIPEVSERKIVSPNEDVIAVCNSPYISDTDVTLFPKSNVNSRQRYIAFKYGSPTSIQNAVEGIGMSCVQGCIYEDNGWFGDTMDGTTGDWMQHDAKGWGAVNIGIYAVRKPTNGTMGSTLIYKECKSNYAPGGDGTASAGHPLIQCNFSTGRWLQHGIYYYKCIPSGCTEFAFHVSQQSWSPTVEVSNVKMQAWGASGGTGQSYDDKTSYGGRGGYSYGEISRLQSGHTFFIIVGETGGWAYPVNVAAAGGGGKVFGGCGGKDISGAPGGGGTRIYDNGYVMGLVAGGGGGGGGGGAGNGGHGGGANQSGTCGNNTTSFNTATSGCPTGAGNPGTTTAGGTANATYANAGSKFTGGDAKRQTKTGNYCGGAGGGGWFGGASGEYGKSDNGGGGGGSGYSVGLTNVKGSTGVMSGHGFARICWGMSKACDTDSSAPNTTCGSLYASTTYSNKVQVSYGANNWAQVYLPRGVQTTCSHETWGITDPESGATKRCDIPNGFGTYVQERSTFTPW